MEKLIRFALSIAAPLCCSLVGLSASCGGANQGAAATPAASASSAPSSIASTGPTAAPTEAASLPPGCVAPAKALAPLARVEIVGDALVVCVGGKADATVGCLAVDPKSGKTQSAPAWTRGPTGALPPPPAPERQRAAYEVKATVVDVVVCKAGTTECKTVHPGYAALPGVGFGEDYVAGAAEKTASTKFTRKLIAAANDDGTKVFVLAAELSKKGTPATRSAWTVFGDTFDVASGKRLSRVPLLGVGGSSNAITDPGARWQAAWVGNRVWLAAFDRAGASAQEFLDPAAGTTLDLGDPSFLLPAGDAWLVGTSKGGVDLVKIVEPKSLANLGKYGLPGAPTPAGDGLSSFAVMRPDGTAWVAFANPPGVAVIDVVKHSASTPTLFSICP